MAQHKAAGLTPLMQQYCALAQRYPDAILFFQVGDFYELFFDDAQKVAHFLGIALTQRGTCNGEPIPLCGVPVHAANHYIAKLVRGGFTIALCQQLQEPQPGKVVERGVTQVFTPGTLTDSSLLDEKSASYLLSVYPETDGCGLVFVELLTAQIHATVVPLDQDKMLEAELARFFPDEIVAPTTSFGKQTVQRLQKLGYAVSHAPDESTESIVIDAWIEKQFGLEKKQVVYQSEALRLALHQLYAYLAHTKLSALDHFKHLALYKPDDFVIIDAASQKNLELVMNNRDGGRSHTLLSVVDGAVTAMGSRMVKKWLVRPLVNKEAITQRHDVVQQFIGDVVGAQQIRQLLRELGDIERVIGRIALGRAPVHDYLHLNKALSLVPQIKRFLTQKSTCSLLVNIEHCLVDFSALQQLLTASLEDESGSEWLIKKGFDHELDAVRELVENAQQAIFQLERKEQAATGITSLKVRYNSVHGYYIEVTKANMHLVPEQYNRQQTLVGKERYTTDELQKLEHKINRARTEIGALEKRVYEQVKSSVLESVGSLKRVAYALAHLDALIGFAHCAYEYGYVRPVFTEQREIMIVKGRHPVVERVVGQHYRANDTRLNDEESLWIITGPNMGGKSTYLRQVALITILAQSGSFVPAQEARLFIVDRVFTRIGAGDNLAEGKSTFLVEMEETALICTTATERSLIILDEVGRGTSTFDGLAIAQAVVEYIYGVIGARCLFATHYHELITFNKDRSGVASYYAASKKDDQIIFLYTMLKGSAEGSFGLDVARLAALPDSVVTRAHELLATLTHSKQELPASMDSSRLHELERENRQLKGKIQSMETAYHAATRISSLDYDDLSPKKAFDILWELKEGSAQKRNYKEKSLSVEDFL